MNQSPFGLLEFGSNSLKFYRVERDPVRGYAVATQKLPWTIAYQFFSEGALSEAAVSEILAALQKVTTAAPDLPLPGMLSVATGVFRELPELEKLAARIQEEAGLRLRVISGEDEAKLMARGFKTTSPDSIILADLGGATTEWAWIDHGLARSCGSLRLGAIRNYCALEDSGKDPAHYLERSQALCDEELGSLPVSRKCSVLVTGGTAKALARYKKSAVIPQTELRETIQRIQTNGPPESLEQERRKVFLPGLVILERLGTRFQADAIEYARTSVREGMAMRLVDLLGKREAKDLRSTLLLRADDSGIRPTSDREK